jgi:hypothetical protein
LSTQAATSLLPYFAYGPTVVSTTRVLPASSGQHDPGLAGQIRERIAVAAVGDHYRRTLLAFAGLRNDLLEFFPVATGDRPTTSRPVNPDAPKTTMS